jgi:hypothetical protein
MINIILTFIATYTIGYIITFVLMCLGPDEQKAHGIKQKAQWGVFFAIPWPITLPIIISCIPYSIISWIKQRKQHRIQKTYPDEIKRNTNLWKSNPPFLYAKPIPSEIIEDAFNEK